jgi:hypothetical protein
MIKLINEDLFRVTDEKKPGNNNRIFFMRDIFISNDLVYPQWKIKENPTGDKAKITPKPFIRVYSEGEDPNEFNTELLTAINPNNRTLNTVRANSYIKDDKASDIFVIALPFNGIIAPLEITSTMTYKITKGSLIKSDAIFTSIGQKYTKALFLVLNAYGKKHNAGDTSPYIRIDYHYYCNEETLSTQDINVMRKGSLSLTYSHERYLSNSQNFSIVREFEMNLPPKGTKLFNVDTSDAKHISYDK